MDRQYCAYLSDSERQMLIEDYKFEVESAKLALMIESVERRSEIQMKEAEIKILSEGGTYDDLAYMYDAVMLEAEENKKKMGIGDRISHLIQLLIDGFRTLLSGKSKFLKSGEETVEVDGEYQEQMSIIDSVVGSIGELLSAIKSHITQIIGGAGIGVLGTTLVTFLLKYGVDGFKTEKKYRNAKKMKKEQIMADSKTCNDLLNQINDINDELKKIELQQKDLNKEDNKTDTELSKAEKSLEKTQNKTNSIENGNKIQQKLGSKKLPELKKKQEELEEQVKNLKEQSESNKITIDEYKRKSEELNKQLTELRQEYDELSKKVKEEEKEYKSMDKKSFAKNEDGDSYPGLIETVKKVINFILTPIRIILTKVKSLFNSNSDAETSDEDNEETAIAVTNQKNELQTA